MPMAATASPSTPAGHTAIAIDGRARVLIDGIQPSLQQGRFAVKRATGEQLTVSATVYVDGHDAVRADLLFRAPGGSWSRHPMHLADPGLDRWEGSVECGEPGRYAYAVEAWVDRYGSWRRGLERWVAAGRDVGVELRAGASILRDIAAATAAPAAIRTRLAEAAAALEDESVAQAARVAIALAPGTAELAAAADPRLHATRSAPLPLMVDPALAACSAWYELFPRSAAPDGRHGTFADVEALLPEIAAMGFDVLYLPPIHPIGRTARKGRNNAPTAGPGDVGSPWAIGAAEGGHDAIHPDLGTPADFRHLVARARDYGIAVAMDLAFQCSPDHPWISEHPEWFSYRPDGSIRHAENPPKTYEDIVPLNFECEDWQSLWEALRDIVLHWVGEGVLVFRVDNPHTKPFAFWEWLIAEVKARDPRVFFLAEAFTRPALLHGLALRGFSQSYNYFAWRNTRHEVESYLRELTSPPVPDYLRPSFWPNTPDILTEYLQAGGRPAFIARFVLAATLAPNYGIYGPAFELCEAVPREPGSEEYLHSEKYEVRHWQRDAPWSLRDIIARVNRVRREHAALRQPGGLAFHPVDNDRILCYSRVLPGDGDAVIVAVNVDPHHRQAGTVHIDPALLGVVPGSQFQVHDLLGGGRYLWQGGPNYLDLDPAVSPAQIFVPRRRVRTEHDFEYFQ
jgi:starch synthase (maltosyl-transferring)